MAHQPSRDCRLDRCLLRIALIAVATAVFTLPLVGTSAQPIVTRNSFLTGGVTQVEESANFGLVFTGPQFNYGMKWHIDRGGSLVTLEYELGLAVLFSKEIPALGFRLKPVEAAYLFRLPVLGSALYVGPSSAIEYRYNLYPDLQSGFDYWFTNFSVGLSALYQFVIKESFFRILLSSSFAGFTSRQPENRNPHFYDLGFSNAIRHLHQEVGAVPVGDLNIARLECWWRPQPDSRITLGYLFTFDGYHSAPEINAMGHGVKLVFNPRGK